MAIYILPGMGADASMYGEIFRSLDEVNYINWPVYNDEQSIPEVAKRIIRENNIQKNDIAGGSSLGGIVAAEIARCIKLRCLILIGSTLTPDYINPILKKLSVLTEITPINLIQTFAGKANVMIENKLLTMFSHSETLFIKSMCRAVFDWEGNKTPNCKVAHIHGEKDTVIFPPSKCTRILKDGGHLIAMTHETEVSEFIKEITIHTNQ